MTPAYEQQTRRHISRALQCSWIGQDSPGLSAGLPDVDPARPERKKAVNLLIAIRGAAGEVKMHAVLDRLGIGNRHEALADGRVLLGPDDDLVLPLGQDLPAQRLRPEPGQAGQIVCVNDDVVESDGHADSMRGTAGSGGGRRRDGRAGRLRAYRPVAAGPV